MHEQISSEEKNLIQKAMMEEVPDFFPFFAVTTKIRELWDEKPRSPEFMLPDLEELFELEEKDLSENIEQTDYIEPDSPPLLEQTTAYEVMFDLEVEKESVNWLIGLTSEFTKSVKKVDKKLKGRILDAIEMLSIDPVTVRGDTIKPLENELAGTWRCRIGDFRLFYWPDNKTKQITLLKFSSRGSAYPR